jgi:hypothetical protein
MNYLGILYLLKWIFQNELISSCVGMAKALAPRGLTQESEGTNPCVDAIVHPGP